MADKIVVLSAGRIEQVGTPLDLHHHPRNLFVAGFIGSPRMNTMPAHVVSADAACVRLRLAGGVEVAVPVDAAHVRPGAEVTFGIRPEHLALDPADGLAGTTLVAERLGNVTVLYVDLAGGPTVVVQVDGNDPTAAHAPVRLTIVAGAGHVFDATGAALPRLTRHPLA